MTQVMPMCEEQARRVARNTIYAGDGPPARFCRDLAAIEDHIVAQLVAGRATPHQAALEAIAALPPR